jgi:hypothetical protein
VWFGRWGTKNASQILGTMRWIMKMKGENKNKSSSGGSECHFGSRGKKVLRKGNFQIHVLLQWSKQSFSILTIIISFSGKNLLQSWKKPICSMMLYRLALCSIFVMKLRGKECGLVTIWTCMAKNRVFHARTKHIKCHYHFVQKKVMLKEVAILHISSTQ